MDIIYALIMGFSAVLLISLIDFMTILKSVIYLIVASFVFYEIALNIDSSVFSLTFFYLSLIFILLIPFVILINYVEKLLQIGKNSEE